MTDAELKLHKLAVRLRKGWAKLHPVTGKQLTAVREAVRQQWEQTHRSQWKVAKEQSEKPTHLASEHSGQQRKQTAKQQQHKSQSHDHGHSH